jgi:hypothetical protein
MNHRSTSGQLDFTLQRNCEMSGLRSCLEVEFFGLLRVALPFPQFALLSAIPRAHPTMGHVTWSRQVEGQSEDYRRLRTARNVRTEDHSDVRLSCS